MESKDVTKEINKIIRPLLKEKGFNFYTGRTYWRQQSDRIDILNFQSFNSYNASVMGCTTFSFCVNLSTLLNYVPSDTTIKEKTEIKTPSEAQGHFRSRVLKGIKQIEFQGKDLWYIDENGRNLKEVILDCKSQIQEKGLSWFNKFDTKEKVFQILNEDEMDMDGTWGFGNKNSPNRNRLLAYTAIELGSYNFAIEKLKFISEFYQEQYTKIKWDYYLNIVIETEKEIELIVKNYT